MNNELILNLLYYGGFAVMIAGCIVWNRLHMPIKLLGMIMAIVGGVCAIITNKMLFPNDTMMSVITILIVCGSLLGALFIYHPKNSKE